MAAMDFLDIFIANSLPSCGVLVMRLFSQISVFSILYFYFVTYIFILTLHPDLSGALLFFCKEIVLTKK
jgi:hypothetical protein